MIQAGSPRPSQGALPPGWVFFTRLSPCRPPIGTTGSGDVDTLCDVWEPIGPLPASVYWRRRALAAVTVAGAVVLVGSLVTGAAPPDAAPVAAAPSRPVAVPLPTVPTVDGVPVCSDDMIEVASEIDRVEHRVGQQPLLRLVVTNVGAQPCVRDLDPARQEIVVRSADGQLRLWSSNDCGNPSTADPRTLQPNQPLGFRVPWTGRTTTPGCAEDRTEIPPGSYLVTSRVDAVNSEPTPFRRLP